jgi:hypothetical protein
LFTNIEEMSKLNFNIPQKILEYDNEELHNLIENDSLVPVQMSRRTLLIPHILPGEVVIGRFQGSTMP